MKRSTYTSSPDSRVVRRVTRNDSAAEPGIASDRDRPVAAPKPYGPPHTYDISSGGKNAPSFETARPISHRHGGNPRRTVVRAGRI
ncbi:protein of unknown function [Pararobbsia alpina]